MARLDSSRIAAWRGLQALVGQIERGLDEELRADWDIPLGWFDVLASLQRLGGRARPLDIAADLRLPPSSLSRRLDRLQEEGWVARHRDVPGADLRAGRDVRQPLDGEPGVGIGPGGGRCGRH